MQVGLLIIGDEILAGHTLDTNTRYLARSLASQGLQLGRVVTCTDAIADIVESLQELTRRTNLEAFVTSGGLGPTHDDRTMEAVAEFMGTQVRLRPELEEGLEAFTRKRYEEGWSPSPTPNAGHRKMAMIPDGTDPLPNPFGVALGCIADVDGRQLFTLPGVPAEFHRMVDQEVLPRLPTLQQPTVLEYTFSGHESPLHDLLLELEKTYRKVAIGSYPDRGQVKIRATGDEEEARAVIAAVQAFLESS